MKNFFNNRVFFFIVLLLVIQASVSIFLLQFLSVAAEKASNTYNYDIPRFNIIAKLEFLHEYRFGQLLMFVHATGIQEQKDIAEELSHTSLEVISLLRQLKSLSYMQEDKAMLEEYISLRERIVDLRDNEVFPLFLSGLDKDAMRVINERLYPVFEKRRHLVKKISDQIFLRSEQAGRDLFLMTKQSQIIASAVFLFSVIISGWFFTLYRRSLMLQEQAFQQLYQIEALKTTMNTVNDIVFNALSGLRLFLYSALADNKMSAEDFQECDNLISNAVEQLKRLGDVDRFEPYEIAEGIQAVKVA